MGILEGRVATATGAGVDRITDTACTSAELTPGIGRSVARESRDAVRGVIQ